MNNKKFVNIFFAKVAEGIKEQEINGSGIGDEWYTETIRDKVYHLESRPSWVKWDDIRVDIDDEYVDIVMFGDYHIRLYNENSNQDIAYCDNGGGYSKADMEYAIDIMNNRDNLI
jgi:hypothetical protein